MQRLTPALDLDLAQIGRRGMLQATNVGQRKADDRAIALAELL